MSGHWSIMGHIWRRNCHLKLAPIKMASAVAQIPVFVKVELQKYATSMKIFTIQLVNLYFAEVFTHNLK